jgi:hypothetical protein
VGHRQPLEDFVALAHDEQSQVFICQFGLELDHFFLQERKEELEFLL